MAVTILCVTDRHGEKAPATLQEQQAILTTSPEIVLVGCADVVSDSILHPQTFR
jgi:hypothetical protein